MNIYNERDHDFVYFFLFYYPFFLAIFFFFFYHFNFLTYWSDVCSFEERTYLSNHRPLFWRKKYTDLFDNTNEGELEENTSAK